jgi:hypothetical protein
MYIIYKNYLLEGETWYYLGDGNVNDFNKELHIPTGSINYLLSENPINDSDFYSSYELDWNLEKGSISPLIINMEVAKIKFIDDMREARVSILDELDIQFMRTLETGNPTTEIVAKKQQLRDLPTMNLSDVTTIDELKGKWPTDLLGNSPYGN